MKFQNALCPAAVEFLHPNIILVLEKRLPKFSWAIEKASYADGCKVYVQDGAALS